MHMGSNQAQTGKAWFPDASRSLLTHFYTHNPVGIYLLKVNNRNTRATCEICSKYFTSCSNGSIVNFEHVNADWEYTLISGIITCL